MSASVPKDLAQINLTLHISMTASVPAFGVVVYWLSLNDWGGSPVIEMVETMAIILAVLSFGQLCAAMVMPRLLLSEGRLRQGAEEGTLFIQPAWRSLSPRLSRARRSWPGRRLLLMVAAGPAGQADLGRTSEAIGSPWGAATCRAYRGCSRRASPLASSSGYEQLA